MHNKIYLMRHGQALAGPTGYIIGYQKSKLDDLTKEGWKQSIEAGKKIRSIVGSENYIHNLYVSDSVRAIKSMQGVVEGMGTKPVVMCTDYLRERNLGDMEGKCIGELCISEEDSAKLYATDMSFCNAESLEKYVSRLQKALEHMKDGKGAALVVSHNLSINAIASLLTGKEISADNYRPLDNCGMWLLVRENGKYVEKDI